MNDPSTSQKSYWKIISRMMNKCQLLVDNKFILNCSEIALLLLAFSQNSAHVSLIPVCYHHQIYLLIKQFITYPYSAIKKSH